MKPLAIGVAILAVLLFRGTCQHFAPRAKVTVEEVVDPAPVRSVCDWIPEHVGCPGARK